MQIEIVRVVEDMKDMKLKDVPCLVLLSFGVSVLGKLGDSTHSSKSANSQF